MSSRAASVQITRVPSALLISGAWTCCVPHRHTPHNSTAFICRGKSCPSPSELSEPLLPEPEPLCCWQAAQDHCARSPCEPRDAGLLRQSWTGCSVSLHGVSSSVTNGNTQQSQHLGILQRPLHLSSETVQVSKPQRQVSGYPYLRDITAMILATIKLSNHFFNTPPIQLTWWPICCTKYHRQKAPGNPQEIQHSVNCPILVFWAGSTI